MQASASLMCFSTTRDSQRTNDIKSLVELDSAQVIPLLLPGLIVQHVEEHYGIHSTTHQEVNKGGGGPALFKVMATSTTRKELEEGLNAIANGRDFMYFADNAHHRWLDTYLGAKGTPVTYVYTIGNPLIAQTMLRHDLTAGLNVPVKILILEKADGSGTKVIYDDPASIIPVTLSGGIVNEELRKVPRHSPNSNQTVHMSKS
ncbi:hypothetical protein A0H81_03098 [Grifola frondosa]|uniref:DUF302 domain-containing protein n=1 Tax=Grifola frondosa TaxID=5627 RepID=A0A1C7MIC9_GRIFR|nr:hypothetical protein A0H81_03098 [Grifola frondosa]